MDARVTLTWSVGIVFAGVLGLGISYKDGRLMGYVKGKNGSQTVKAQTCLNVNEIAALNLNNALGCPDGKKAEISREFTGPTAPITLSSTTNGVNQTLNLKAMGKHSMRPGIDAEASLSIEIWNSHPEKRNSNNGLNGPRYQQAILWDSKLGKMKVANQSLSPIQTPSNDKLRGRHVGVGTQALTTVGNTYVSAAPADVNRRFLTRDYASSLSAVATTTR